MSARTKPLEVGGRHGCWTVVRQSASDTFGRRRYLVRCDCGNELVRTQWSVVNASRDHCSRCRPKPPGKPWVAGRAS